jgi:thiol-disulfide isomerase/thioredoxin
MDNLALYDLFLPNIFPPLPDDFSQNAIEWKSNKRTYGDSLRYNAAKPDLDERSWIIKVKHMTPLDEIYSMSQKAETYIDLIKGVPIYKKEEGVRGYGYYAGKSAATAILDSIVDFDPSFATRYSREIDIFLSTDSTYSDILSQAENNPAKLALSRSSAEYVLLQTSARITIPEIKMKLNRIINQVPEDFEQITEQIKRRTKLINKPSPEWEAEDFSGQRHSLDDFAGNVIVLDFWYRACPWCIRAMSSIDQVARYFEGKPVSVLGVNTDREREDAIFVIEKKNPSYINISGRDLIKKYGVINYPTFIVIDRNGLVRRILIGYEPELTEKLVDIVESLL